MPHILTLLIWYTKMPHILIGVPKKNASYFNVTYLVCREECLIFWTLLIWYAKKNSSNFKRYLFGVPEEFLIF